MKQYLDLLQKIRNATVKYLQDFDPDSGSAVGYILAGEGPAMELCKAKNMRWAGMVRCLHLPSISTILKSTMLTLFCSHISCIFCSRFTSKTPLTIN